jgi:hypothetical protein
LLLVREIRLVRALADHEACPSAPAQDIRWVISGVERWATDSAILCCDSEVRGAIWSQIRHCMTSTTTNRLRTVHKACGWSRPLLAPDGEPLLCLANATEPALSRVATAVAEKCQAQGVAGPREECVACERNGLGDLLGLAPTPHTAGAVCFIANKGLRCLVWGSVQSRKVEPGIRGASVEHSLCDALILLDQAFATC